MSVEIWWGSGSQPSFLALWAASEKGLTIKDTLLSFSKKEHKMPAILKLNPRGKVPILREGSTVVYESLAIVEYLEAAHPAVPLVPKAAVWRALAYQRYSEIGYLADAMRSKDIDRIRTVLCEMEEILAASPTGYMVPHMEFDRPTPADALLYIYLRFVERYGYPLAGNASSKFPALSAFVAKMKARPACAKWDPPHWKESPAPSDIAKAL